MKKWISRAPADERQIAWAGTAQVLQEERNEALDLLEEMVTHCRWDSHGTRLIPEARALLDRLRRVKEEPSLKDELGNLLLSGRSEDLRKALFILADAIDELKEKVK